MRCLCNTVGRIEKWDPTHLIDALHAGGAGAGAAEAVDGVEDQMLPRREAAEEHLLLVHVAWCSDTAARNIPQKKNPVSAPSFGAGGDFRV